MKFSVTHACAVPDVFDTVASDLGSIYTCPCGQRWQLSRAADFVLYWKPITARQAREARQQWDGN